MTKAAELAKMGEVLTNSQIGGRRNIIINGAMQMAQRGTSMTGTGYLLDRYTIAFSGASVTTSQQSLTSGDPYNDGFRNFIRVANTSTSTAADAYVQIKQMIEAQNVAKSGWQYTSSSSDISISFWVRSSLAGTYYVAFRTYDGSEYIRNVGFTLLADTWTKVSSSVSGNSNLVFNNDNGRGLDVIFVPYYGTTYTGGGEVSTTDWYSRSGQADSYFPNYAQNWANTASATFDVTGVQLEVGSQATPFEHRSFGEELALCQRYLYRISGALYEFFVNGVRNNTNYLWCPLQLPVPLRTQPTITTAGTSNNCFGMWHGTGGSWNTTHTTMGVYANPDLHDGSVIQLALALNGIGGSGFGDGQCVNLGFQDNGFLNCDAEL
mgnify:FL=1